MSSGEEEGDHALVLREATSRYRKRERFGEISIRRPITLALSKLTTFKRKVISIVDALMTRAVG